MLPSGLSPMQERLLRSERFVRLVSAPTGSGKSYAFMRAVLDEEAQVLFIVPTKRLLQNLIEDASEQALDHLRRRGWDAMQSDAWIDERIVEWSGNQSTDGRESLPATRARQVLAGAGHSGGQVIFAIPEVAVRLISGIRIAGASAISPFFYVRHFDHIVFDEFHTIDDRSFGLASLMSLLAVTERRGKVSLLSATPINVTGILARAGTGRDDIETISEEIVDGHPQGHRPIHGNVSISLHSCPLPDLVELNIDAVQASIGDGRTAIIIYDSLQRLQQDEPRIRAVLREAGLRDDRVLAINSIDDSRRAPGESRRGRRYEDPRDYDVLVCTSTVEVGVTFRSTLMFMEPGFGLASFVQRVGRVSRGAEDGQVMVSLPEQRRARHEWTRRIAAVVEQNQELTIQDFTARILRDVRRRIEPTPREAETDPTAPDATVSYYRRPSWRGAFWAALFIAAIRREKMSIQKEARSRLYDLSPGTVKFVEAKIGQILSVDTVNHNLRRQSQPHRRWVNALLVSALTYRDIGATYRIVDPNGNSHAVSESFLRRATDILSRHIPSDDEGEWTIRLMSRTLKEEIRMFAGRREIQGMTLYVHSPIGDGDFALSITERERGTEQLNVRLIEEWRHRFRRLIPAPGETVADPRRKVMGAATALVERLGRPPLDEDYEDSAESALFA